MTDFENSAGLPALPPGYEAYVGTEEPLPNAIGAVEHFFGEPFNSHVVDAVAALPAKQVGRLLSNIRYVTNRASVAIGARNSTDFPSEDTFSALALEDIHVFNTPKEESIRPPSEMQGLKQAALYCARTIIPDTVSARIVDDSPGHVLAHRLRQIEPLAGLIQAGVFIPVPELNPDTGELLLTTLMRSDPYVAHLQRENPSVETRIRTIVESALYKSSLHTDLASPLKPDISQTIQQCTEILCEIYPGISSEKLAKTLLYCSQVRQGNFTPIATDVATTRHLLQCNAAAFQGGESSYSRVMQQAPSSSFEPAITYSVPALSEVSFADILALRRDQEVFAKMNVALGALSKACGGQLQQADSYEAYLEIVRQHSEGTIQPIYDELSRWHAGALRREQVIGVSAEVVGLGVDLVSVPGLSKLATAATRRLATGKRTVALRTNAGIGARILKTFL